MPYPHPKAAVGRLQRRMELPFRPIPKSLLKSTRKRRKTITSEN